ncbi:superoxide dismutase [Lactarius akahatsu]|uniref:Superoxide dismutase [Cu-Zn] n=1 Tax=Lactarius akahatsu TaxID=416441 RepID=A0AAD4LNI3_9AGAM|nr:superoxide dismutase [Lactarius akahatsu]
MDSRRTSQRARPILIASVLAVAFVTYLWVTSTSSKEPFVYRAVAVLSGDSQVTGTVVFEQTSKSSPVVITGELKSLDPLASRGFHIHELGDITNGCASTGSHFNPLGKTHGAPTTSERHVGDLGNIKSDEIGAAKFTLTDNLISLNGPRSILGRAVVVHAGTDDFGLGGDEESLKTGNAGARAACGIIGISDRK